MEDSPRTRTVIVGVAIAAVIAFIQFARTPPDAPEVRPPDAPQEAAAPAPAPAGQVITYSQGAFPYSVKQPVIVQQYAESSISVAVPDAFNHIRYLPGNDPEAISYLEQTRALEDSLTLDNGPADIDPATLPVAHGAFPKAKSLHLSNPPKS